MRRQLLAWGALAVLGCLTGCADPNRKLVAGRYFTTLTEDGDPVFCLDDPQLGPVTLTFSYAAGVTRGYVVACGDSCYIYPAAAATAEEARRARLGTLDEAACQQKIIQLTGDSLQLTQISI